MEFYLGVDGGATKTLSILGDQNGNVLGTGLSGPSNYQNVGLEPAMHNVEIAVNEALIKAGVTAGDVHGAVFAMAGADYPMDFETLNRGLSGQYPNLRYELTNDVWAAFRSGTEKHYGAVIVSGTGANYGAKTPDGRTVVGRGMGYEWGLVGGAESLVRRALHHAFRSRDGTGPKTGLEEAVLSEFGFSSYDALSLRLYQVGDKLLRQSGRLVPRMFELAFLGDQVSQDILARTGDTMGDIMGRLARNTGLHKIPFDIISAGSTFTKAKTSIMFTSFKAACRKYTPLAVFRFPQMEPGAGAYLMALENAGKDAAESVRAAAIKSTPARG